MTVGEILVNEKTRVSLSIITFVVLVGSVVTGSFTVATWKTQQEAENARLETMIVNEVQARIESDEDINEKLDEVMPMLLQTQTDMAEIKTDLKWIRAVLENK